MEQFTTFIEQLPAIESALKAKGISIPRPKYGGSSAKAAEEDENEEVDEHEDEVVKEPGKKAISDVDDDEEPLKPVKPGRLDKFKHKANHEATSEEDN